MARKKKRTYGDMARDAAGIEAEMAAERARMAGIMAGALASGGAAAKLGDCPDGDLRRVMVMVAKDIDVYLYRLAAEKQAHSAAQKKGGKGRRRQAGKPADKPVDKTATEKDPDVSADTVPEEDGATSEPVPAERDIFTAYGNVQSDDLEIPGLEAFGSGRKNRARTG